MYNFIVKSRIMKFCDSVLLESNSNRHIPNLKSFSSIVSSDFKNDDAALTNLGNEIKEI